MDKIGFALGVIGGFGLGFLLGREFSSITYVTYIGAILIAISIILTAYFLYKNKK